MLSSFKKGIDMMKIGMISLGCAKNLVDSEMILALFERNGCTIVNKMNEADVLVINTCGFINPAKEEGINTILEGIDWKDNDNKKLIVTGCLAKRYKKELELEMPEVDLFIGNDEYPYIENILGEFLGFKFSCKMEQKSRKISTSKWTSYLRIGDGCSNNCTYCAIPLIRGSYHSFSVASIVEEAKILKEKGVEECVVIAQDTTKYGVDLFNKPALEVLLEELVAIDFKWIRVLYMYPDEITDELLECMKKHEGKIIPYFDIPLQHASNPVLKDMNRRGTKEEYLALIKKIKAMFKHPVLRTTMIVGFPTEGTDNFEELLEFVKEAKFDLLGAFTYSKEEDTKAYDFEETISEDEKRARLDRLMTLQQQISFEENKKHIGEEIEVVVEAKEGLTNYYKARGYMFAPDNIDGWVKFKSKENIPFGSFVKVRIIDTKGYDLIAEKL